MVLFGLNVGEVSLPSVFIKVSWLPSLGYGCRNHHWTYGAHASYKMNYDFLNARVA